MTNHVTTSKPPQDFGKYARLIGALAIIITYAPALAGAAPAVKKTPAAQAKPKPAVQKAPQQPVKKATALQPYTETISGTLVRWDMVPIPAPAGGKPFWMSKTEVTWDAYDVFALRLDLTEEQRTKGVDATSRPSNPYGAPDRGFGHQGYPAVSLTYLSAQEFCRWLSAKTGKKYRLPTEAEWEHAARAGTASAPLPSKELASIAWHWENADDKTHPVATLKPNAWGLYDMLGNAGEWCTGKDGKPVLRGGTFADKAADVTVSTRALQTPDWNVTDPQNPKSRWWLSDGPFAGFRIVRDQ